MIIRTICRFLLRLSGWRLDDKPLPARCVLIAYPHTSNWDFILAMLAKGALGLRFHWLGKRELFRWPISTLMRALGGIAVDRQNPTGLIDDLVQHFQQRNELIIGLTPEGTRSFRPYWKSGFYRLALAAEVPIVLAYIDFSSKTLGIGPSIEPSGDLARDFAIIKAFYQPISPKYPDLAAPIELQNSAD